MATTDFTKKGLNQQIFSKKAVKAIAKGKSSAFRGIMANKEVAHVLDKASEKRVFYSALKKRGAESSRGITRNVMKKVMGDIEHSGEFSHNEMMELRKDLVGGSMSSNITREHGSKKEIGRSSQEAYREIMDKRKASQADASSVDAQKNNNSAAIKSSFGISENNLRNAQQLFVRTDDQHSNQNNSSSVAEYIANHKNSESDTDSIKARLAKIQEEPDKNKKINLDV